MKFLTALITQKITKKRLLNALFLIFLFLSLGRPVLFGIYLLGIGDGYTVHLYAPLFSPQTVVFYDRANLRAIFICQNFTDGRRRCMEKSVFIRTQTTEPYFLGGLTIAHNLEYILRWPNRIDSFPAADRLLDFTCTIGVMTVEVSPDPLILGPIRSEIERYEFSCP